MSNIYEELIKTLQGYENYQLTENGAVGFKTTGKPLLDLNFSIPKLRGMEVRDIVEASQDAFSDTAFDLMLKWIFYVRDVRSGLGERKIFKALMGYLACKRPDDISHLVQWIPLFGKWNDMWDLLDTPLRDTAIDVVKHQLLTDIDLKDKNANISLLGKWLPSINANNDLTRHYALIICRDLGLPYKTYRKMLAELREYIDVVEKRMSANEWDQIRYSAVPSKANLIYSNAFMRHDPERRLQYIEDLKAGITKINSSTLFPHEIVAKIRRNNDDNYDVEDQLWNALPDYVNGNSNTMVIRDGSGSMVQTTLNNTQITPHDIATALTIYFSERMSGPFRNKFITFSSRPEVVDLTGFKTFHEKVEKCYNYADYTNTDIEKVFDLLLETAVNAKMRQGDLPKSLLIVSDMEFDEATTNASMHGYKSYVNQKLFAKFAHVYSQYGYKLPKLIFWNVANRSGAIPVIENELGVILISGYSINLAKMVLSEKNDPMEALLEQLLSERYAVIRSKNENHPVETKNDDKQGKHSYTDEVRRILA